jgi:hypothetical protein
MNLVSAYTVEWFLILHKEYFKRRFIKLDLVCTFNTLTNSNHVTLLASCNFLAMSRIHYMANGQYVIYLINVQY